jgi:acetoin utilization deacetylase AcuC-like enzyme
VHHGNGTQEIFYADRSVLYLSTHQSRLYPYTGIELERGRDDGLCFTINCPIDAEGEPRIKVLAAFKEKLLPAMKEFQPELIIISAGFDARAGDRLGQFDLTDYDFMFLTKQVMEIADECADGRILSMLEGGYNLPGLAGAVHAHVTALLGRD